MASSAYFDDCSDVQRSIGAYGQSANIPYSRSFVVSALRDYGDAYYFQTFRDCVFYGNSCRAVWPIVANGYGVFDCGAFDWLSTINFLTNHEIGSCFHRDQQQDLPVAVVIDYVVELRAVDVCVKVRKLSGTLFIGHDDERRTDLRLEAGIDF